MLFPLNVWQRSKYPFPLFVINGQKFCTGAGRCVYKHTPMLHVSKTSCNSIVSRAVISGHSFSAAAVNHPFRNIENTSFPTAFVWKS